MATLGVKGLRLPGSAARKCHIISGKLLLFESLLSESCCSSDSVGDGHQSAESSTVNHSSQRSSEHHRGTAVGKHHRRHDSDSDQDVPRHRAQQGHRLDADLSPTRDSVQRHHCPSSDVSLARARSRTDQRHDSDSDLSPVRAGRRQDANSDLSPKRATKRPRNDSDSDLSPARTTNRSALNTAQSVSCRHDSDSDLSPARTKRLRDSDGDFSPLRRDHQNSNRSSRQPSGGQQHRSSPADTRNTKQKVSQQDFDIDLSPKRRPRNDNLAAVKKHRRNDSDSDLSPPRAKKPQKTSVHNDDRQNVTLKATKTLSGAQAGLQLAADMRKESKELRRRENASFAKVCFDTR